MARRILLGLWLTAGVVVLLLAFSAREHSDADIVFAYFMLFLTFPIGLAVAWLIAGLGALVSIPGGFASSAMMWPLFMFAGYWQWFVALPRVYHWLRKPSVEPGP